jgi:phospholipid/cholesterol/gamma-HCH transport system substrate-binding protein
MKIGAPLTKLIVFATLTVALTAALAQTLGSLGFGGGTRYRAYFSDVTGLLVGDDVRIAGVRVGRIQKIGLAAGQPSVAEVQFTVDDDVPLATSVLAKIRYRNLIGQRYLALTEGPDGGADGGAPAGGIEGAVGTGRGPGGGQRLGSGGLIPLTQTAPALDLTVVFNGFRPLFVGLSPEDVNRLMFEIIQVLQGEGGTIVSLLGHTASLTGTLADRDTAIGNLITNLNDLLATLAERDANLDVTVAQLQEFVSGLAADRAAIGEAIGQIADLATVTGSLVHDARPDLAQDVTLLNQLAGTLNNNSQVIESTVQRLPDRYAAMTQVASTGSWFNFFLCDFDGRIGLVQGVDDARPTFSATAARCVSGGGR